MLELVLSSGWIGAIIAVLALIALGLILERVFVYHRESTLMKEFSGQFSEAVQRQDWNTAAQVCGVLRSPDSLGKLWKSLQNSLGYDTIGTVG